MRVVLLAHEQFPGRAKTAVGLLRYAEHEVVAVLDRATAGDRVLDHVTDVQDAPIVATMAEAPACDALVIGIAPIGGGLVDGWRPDIRAAIERGCDVIAGLHSYLAEDDTLRRLAATTDTALRDVRRPPDELSVAAGTAGAVDARVVLTVGTDCSTGKMTTSFELRDAARERGIDAAVVPTGQTGIMIADRGTAIDRVASDFAAGAVEQLVEAAADHDLLIVEGQGALAHPAYSGVTTALLHGAQPDAMVLCHLPNHETVRRYESFAIPDPPQYAELYEHLAAPVSGAAVTAGALNTQALAPKMATAAVEEYAAELEAPATDPVRFGAGDILEAVL